MGGWVGGWVGRYVVDTRKDEWMEKDARTEQSVKEVKQ